MAYFDTLDRSKALLRRLSKMTGDFYNFHEQDFFLQCRPTIFSASIEMLTPYTNLADLAVVKVLHVRDDLFIILYAGGLIEMRDLSSPSARPMYSFEVPDTRGEEAERGEAMDLDFKEDETNLIIAFKNQTLARLNLITAKFEMMQRIHGDLFFTKSDLLSASFIKTLPGVKPAYFLIYRSAGRTDIIDENAEAELVSECR